jgi:hypothetical protein
VKLHTNALQPLPNIKPTAQASLHIQPPHLIHSLKTSPRDKKVPYKALMFSDELYRRLIQESKPTVEDKYGVHFEYDDLYARLLQVKQSQLKQPLQFVEPTAQLPTISRTKRSGASTERAARRTISSNRLKSTFTVNLKSSSPPQRKQRGKSLAKEQGLMLRTISYKAAPGKMLTARQASGERTTRVYGRGTVKRGKKIPLR